MESEVLQVLEFNFTFPTSLSFLETYMTAIGTTDLPTELYTRYLLELSLTQLSIQRHKPSNLALASLLVAWKKIGQIEPYFKAGLGPETQAIDQLIKNEASGST